jgi:hypothetical protein
MKSRLSGTAGVARLVDVAYAARSYNSQARVERRDPARTGCDPGGENLVLDEMPITYALAFRR